jgi:hypothetical protein
MSWVKHIFVSILDGMSPSYRLSGARMEQVVHEGGFFVWRGRADTRANSSSDGLRGLSSVPKPSGKQWRVLHSRPAVIEIFNDNQLGLRGAEEAESFPASSAPLNPPFKKPGAAGKHDQFGTIIAMYIGYCFWSLYRKCANVATPITPMMAYKLCLGGYHMHPGTGNTLFASDGTMSAA